MQKFTMNELGVDFPVVVYDGVPEREEIGEGGTKVTDAAYAKGGGKTIVLQKARFIVQFVLEADAGHRAALQPQSEAANQAGNRVGQRPESGTGEHAMNKVREILEKIKRHQFWILCGIVALVGIISWWMATGSLADTYGKNKAKIESYEKKVKEVETAPAHHNDTSISRYKEQTEQTKKQVYDAWQKIYDEQKAKVYVWPADVLGQDIRGPRHVARSKRAKSNWQFANHYQNCGRQPFQKTRQNH